jgi:hypothetical protein
MLLGPHAQTVALALSATQVQPSFVSPVSLEHTAMSQQPLHAKHVSQAISQTHGGMQIALRALLAHLQLLSRLGFPMIPVMHWIFFVYVFKQFA